MNNCSWRLTYPWTGESARGVGKNIVSYQDRPLVEQSPSHAKVWSPRVAEITQPRFFTGKLPKGAKGLVIYLLFYW